MSIVATTQSTRRSRHDGLSAMAVGAVTLLALLLGAAVRSSVENRSQTIELKGVTASVPANWIVQEGAGDLIFATWDPFVPNVRYAVFLLSESSSSELTDILSRRNLALAQTLESFRVLEESPIIRRGREGYKVTFAYVDSSAPGLPLIFQGVDYYYLTDGRILVISLQANEKDYDEALLRFEPFLDSVSYK